MKKTVANFVKDFMVEDDFPAIMESLVDGKTVQVDIESYCVDLTENSFSEDVFLTYAEIMEDTYGKAVHLFYKLENETPVFEYYEEAYIFKLSRDIQRMSAESADHYNEILQGLKNDLEQEKKRG